MQDPYTYIIFRASEVKDLAVDEPANQRRNVHDDPAVIGVSITLLSRDRLSCLMKTLTDVTSKCSVDRERIKPCGYPVAFLLTIHSLHSCVPFGNEH